MQWRRRACRRLRNEPKLTFTRGTNVKNQCSWSISLRSKAVFLLFAWLFCANSVAAQKHEIGLTIGSAQPEDVLTEAGRTNVKNGFAFQFDYSGRIFNAGVVALYANTPFAIATNNTIEVPQLVSASPREYRSYYFTPGLKVKVLPDARVSPYVVGGYGFARLVPRNRAANDTVDIFDRVKEFSQAYSFGGGADVKINEHIAIRGEVRSYHTKPFDLESFGVEVPGVDLSFLRERQRNLFVTGGIVFRF
jgi:opacity protein-like surface antigen